jgi:hypothetical protein
MNLNGGEPALNCAETPIDLLICALKAGGSNFPGLSSHRRTLLIVILA